MAPVCTGADIDLLSVIKSRNCTIDHAEPWVSREALEATVTLSNEAITPGGKIDVVVTYKNNDSIPLTLVLSDAYAYRYGTPVEAYRERHKPVGESRVLAEGDTSGLITEGHSEITFMTAVDDLATRNCARNRTRDGYSRVVLPPGGSAHVKLPWTASRARSSQATRGMRGLAVGDGCDVVATTALPAGDYTLSIATPVMLASGVGVELGRHLARVHVKN